MGNIERDDHHGDFGTLPLDQRMDILAGQADEEHIAGWAVEVERLQNQLAGAVEALEKIAAAATFAADGDEAIASLARVQAMAEAALPTGRGQSGGDAA